MIGFLVLPVHVVQSKIFRERRDHGSVLLPEPGAGKEGVEALEASRVWISRVLNVAASVWSVASGLSFAKCPPHPGSAATDEMLLFQEIPSVYSASRFEQKITEAPASLTVVTRQEISAPDTERSPTSCRAVRASTRRADHSRPHLVCRRNRDANERDGSDSGFSPGAAVRLAHEDSHQDASRRSSLRHGEGQSQDRRSR